MYYVMRASAPSLHRESTDSLILGAESWQDTVDMCRQHKAEYFFVMLIS